MIHYLTSARFQYTINGYLASVGAPLRGVISPMTWEHAFSRPRLPAGAYVLTDIDRLSPFELELAVGMYRAIEAEGWPILNHPTRTLHRYELLRTLYEAGINRFDVVRLTEARRPSRYPVYLRRFDDHKGSDGGLIDTPEALEARIAELVESGVDRDRYIVEEYCHTADATGMFRKFSAFVVGDHIVPRHIFFGQKWLLRHPTHVDARTIAEELEYLDTNPHKAELARVFRLARQSFGRIDYALLDGKIQVWEINSNPQLITSRDGGGPERKPVHERAARGLEAAFRDLDARAPKRGSVAHRAPAMLLREAGGLVFRRALHHAMALTGGTEQEIVVRRKMAKWLKERGIG